MPRLNWGTTGDRYYETGIDRGVLYVDVNAGVVWNGLTSVNENPSGGEAKPYYLDGVKYINVASASEYEATIQAYSSPPEFDVCDGRVSLYSGLAVPYQSHKPFGLSYRTKLGNDVDGIDHGYKIHLIYNALGAPTGRNNNTISDSEEPIEFSWAITATPPSMSMYRPTAKLEIDSQETDVDLMLQLEDILYGSDVAEPRLPTLEELLDLFSTSSGLIITIMGDGVYSAEGSAVSNVSGDVFAINHKSVVDNGDGSFTIR